MNPEVGPGVCLQLSSELVHCRRGLPLLGNLRRGDHRAVQTAARGTDAEPLGRPADLVGDRRLAPRVNQAVGRNLVSIVIPCHRVVGVDGSLTGYAGGLARKQQLLELAEPAEAAQISDLTFRRAGAFTV